MRDVRDGTFRGETFEFVDNSTPPPEPLAVAAEEGLGQSVKVHLRKQIGVENCRTSIKDERWANGKMWDRPAFLHVLPALRLIFFPRKIHSVCRVELLGFLQKD